jgi:heavy metal translocating P-type ATPase
MTTLRHAWRYRTGLIAVLAAIAIAVHITLRVLGAGAGSRAAHVPLFVALAVGGAPLVGELLVKLARRELGSDLLAGISIVTSILLGEYLAGTIVVLMLAGGEALEAYALRRASSVLRALAQRMPSIAHRRTAGQIEDVPLSDVRVDDVLVIYPHETGSVDGVVIDGHGLMDESYLTGEPFQIRKTAGSTVISGAINGDVAFTVRATRRAEDSRYAKITAVMRESEATRPRLRRLGDQLGAIYTPIALSLAGLAWVISGDPVRFLAVLVIATPCPLLIAIPVAIIGSISLCARRAIVVKNPVALEQIAECRTAIFDKTGTLTYGEPALTDLDVVSDANARDVLALAASVERYSKHPLARAIIARAEREGVALMEAAEVSEPPGAGLRGRVSDRLVQVTSRAKLLAQQPAEADRIPATSAGLECVIVIDGHYAATFRFRDAPRAESGRFVRHLGPRHAFDRVMLLSGDREPEVRYLAGHVGISHVYAQKNPEEKLAIVREETRLARTLYVGDGINDAPAMMAATVGIAIGQGSDVTAEAADLVIMDSALGKVDEFMHISRRMRRIALQSAVGGMLVSLAGMGIAASGLLTPVAGAIGQEVIDVAAVLNALRAAWPPAEMRDF